MDSRPFNFSAGPATLPEPVLERVRAELPQWQGQGASVMEVSHRGEAFGAMAAKAESDLRRLLNIPDDYAVLFMHGSASHQFAMVPMNLLAADDSANYVHIAHWSEKAIREAGRFAFINEIEGVRKTEAGLSLIDEQEWELDEQSRYLHFTSNETIVGIQFPQTPRAFGGKLVCDMSSDILSRPIDVSRYGLIYAGAQKNIGPSGFTVVIVRKDWLADVHTDRVPIMYQYPVMARHQSLYNTPPSFAWYLSGLVFEWLLEQGGVAAMAAQNRQKAELLYQTIDRSAFYTCPVAPDSRSQMNVAFTQADPDLDEAFLHQSRDAGLLALKGHRSLGGMRASLYNAMPLAGVEALVAFMEEFERVNG